MLGPQYLIYPNSWSRECHFENARKSANELIRDTNVRHVDSSADVEQVRRMGETQVRYSMASRSAEIAKFRYQFPVRQNSYLNIYV